MTQDTPRPYPLVSGEIDRQVRVLTALRGKLEALRVLRDRPGELAVLDTNVPMHFQRSPPLVALIATGGEWLVVFRLRGGRSGR